MVNVLQSSYIAMNYLFCGPIINICFTKIRVPFSNAYRTCLVSIREPVQVQCVLIITSAVSRLYNLISKKTPTLLFAVHTVFDSHIYNL